VWRVWARLVVRCALDPVLRAAALFGVLSWVRAFFREKGHFTGRGGASRLGKSRSAG